MAANKPPRKPYRPRGAGHILIQSQHRDMVLPVHLALDAIERGHGNISNRHTLAAGINVAGSVAVNVHGGEAIIPLIDAAKDAIISMDRRYLDKNRWGMSGPEIKAVRAAVLAYSQLLRRANSATVEAAIAHVYKINAQTDDVLGSVKTPVRKAA